MRGVLLQVRLDSTRLPQKALYNLNGLTIIEHAMISLKKVNADIHSIVTTNDSLEALAPLALKQGFEIFTGSKDNVLERYIKAIEHFNLKQFVRATGDNPVVSWELANILIDRHNQLRNDYSGFINNPIGTGVEVVEAEALKKAYNETNSSYDREHVTPYLYNNRDIFKVFQKDAPTKYLLPKSYATIDTKEDYNRIVTMFNELYHGETIGIESVIKWLKKEQFCSTHT